MGNKNTVIEESMFEFLNSWEGKPCEIRLEELQTKGNISMSFNPLAGDKILKKYIDGSYTASFPFAIIIRIFNGDTKHKISAREIFKRLDEWISEKESNSQFVNLPTLLNDIPLKVEMTATPSISARYENGYDDYQAIFQLTFKHKEAKIYG